VLFNEHLAGFEGAMAFAPPLGAPIFGNDRTLRDVVFTQSGAEIGEKE
jgi:hypothetical protein